MSLRRSGGDFDARIARLLAIPESEVRARRGLPGRLAVDSCAGEFEARTPYYYLSHEQGDGDETAAGAIVVLGSGTNRIGQGIEFDYCCVRAAQAFRRLGHEVVLVNSNPETVSTDYDTCDRLYLEPVTLERVLDVVALERPLGVVVSLGGQTPLALAAGRGRRGCRCSATLARSTSQRIAAASAGCSRKSGSKRLRGRTRRRPPRRARSRTGSATRCSSAPPTCSAAVGCASRAVRTSSSSIGPRSSTAFSPARSKLDVDVLCDGEEGWVAAIVEHVEHAGVQRRLGLLLPSPSVGERLEADPRARDDARLRPRRARAAQPAAGAP